MPARNKTRAIGSHTDQQRDWAAEFRALPRTNPGALGKTKIRLDPHDFQVSEILGFDPDGQGEHLFLQIRKTGRNTTDVVRWLASDTGVKERDVGYCGLKDKHAVSTQWFSVYLPGREIQKVIPQQGFEILKQTRHGKKLKRGAHRANRFKLTLRSCTADRSLWEQRLQQIRRHGFANYFGEQRFGRRFLNLDRAADLFEGHLKRPRRQQKSLYLSAARSWLFNQVCAARILNSTWNRAISGERLVLDGSGSYFVSTEEGDVSDRLATLDIHCSGPLWGRVAEANADDQLYRTEKTILQAECLFRRGLEDAGLKWERRALRAVAHELEWRWQDQATLELGFRLTRGCFATSLLREIADYTTGDSQ